MNQKDCDEKPQAEKDELLGRVIKLRDQMLALNLPQYFPMGAQIFHILRVCRRPTKAGRVYPIEDFLLPLSQEDRKKALAFAKRIGTRIPQKFLHLRECC